MTYALFAFHPVAAVPILSSEELSFTVQDIAGIDYREDDRFHIIVSSITTNDEDLFPGVGQIILHSSGPETNHRVKGMIIKGPERTAQYIYLSLEKTNEGKEVDLIYASKFGLRLSVLKAQLTSPKDLISEDRGGVLVIKILKNGVFSNYKNYQFKLARSGDEWIGEVKLRGIFTHFKTIYLKAGRVGVKKVYFE